MTNKSPSFLRLFIGGFAIGAAGLVAAQTAQAHRPAPYPAAQAATAPSAR